jgi:hypothetical protein
MKRMSRVLLMQRLHAGNLPPSPFLIIAQQRNKVFLGDELVADRHYSRR